MSKRWTHTEDMWLCMYGETMGAKSNAEDLGRTIEEIERRTNLLIKSGAMEALSREFEASAQYDIIIHDPAFEDEDEDEDEDEEDEQ